MKLADARKLAKELMKKHIYEEEFSDDYVFAKNIPELWTFEFDNAKSRFGACHWKDKRITLSKILTKLNDEKKVRNMLLHEIAHAICGRKDMHNSTWKKTAISIGCNGDRLYNNEVITPKPKYTLECPNCEREVTRYRKPKALACGSCCKRYNKGKYTKIYQFKRIHIIKEKVIKNE